MLTVRMAVERGHFPRLRIFIRLFVELLLLLLSQQTIKKELC